MKKEVKPTTSIYPLPVIMVTTHDGKGNDNIMTAAWTTNMSSEKPSIGVIIGANSLSSRNIEKTRDFVINIPGQDLLKDIDFCGENHGDHIDKFKETGLTKIKASNVGSRLIAECLINFECRVRDIYPIDSANLIIGEVLKVQMDENIFTDDGKVDFSKLNPVVYSQKTYYTLKEGVATRGFSGKK